MKPRQLALHVLVVTLVAMLLGPLSALIPGFAASASASPAPASMAQQAVDAYNDVCFLKASPDQISDVREYLAEHPVVTMSEVSDNARVCVVEEDGSGYIIHYYSYADGFADFDVYYAMTLRAVYLAGPVELTENYLDPLDHTALLQLVVIDDNDSTVRKSHRKIEKSPKAGGKNLWTRDSGTKRLKAKHHVFGTGSKATIVPINAATRAEIGSKPATARSVYTPSTIAPQAAGRPTTVTPQRVEPTVPVAKRYTAPIAPVRTADKATAEPSTSKPSASSSSGTPRTTQSVVRVSSGRR